MQRADGSIAFAFGRGPPTSSQLTGIDKSLKLKGDCWGQNLSWQMYIIRASTGEIRFCGADIAAQLIPQILKILAACFHDNLSSGKQKRNSRKRRSYVRGSGT